MNRDNHSYRKLTEHGGAYLSLRSYESNIEIAEEILGRLDITARAQTAALITRPLVRFADIPSLPQEEE